MYFSVRTIPISEFDMNCEGVYVLTACAIQVDHSTGLAEFCGKPIAETRSGLKIFSLICEVQLHVKVRRHCLDLFSIRQRFFSGYPLVAAKRSLKAQKLHILSQSAFELVHLCAFYTKT
jgi:hypothetical protein